ncbi:MAG: ABC transporter substrate-binding protein, partial [Candidatus Thorarchaeota archaeon]
MSALKQRHLILTTIILLGLVASGSQFTSPMMTVEIDTVRSPQVSQDTPAIYQGGTVDSISVLKYDTLADALAAVNSGNADLFGQVIQPDDYGLLTSYPNLELQWAYDSRVTLLSVNARSYPLGNSHLRRALAFAINKTQISSNTMGGIVDSVDFLVSLNNEFSLEQTDGGLFYDSNVGQAISELASAGMLDVDEDGVVEAPDGSEFQLKLWYSQDVNGINESALSISADLTSVGINNTLIPMNYTVLQNEIRNHNLTYDLAIYEEEIPRYGIEWAATTFYYTNWINEGENVANANDEILNAVALDYASTVDLEEVSTVARDALIKVRDRCPVIPLFTHRWLSVYNDANFENWMDDTNGGAFSVWNPVSVRARAGADNELVVAVLPDYFETFYTSLNPFESEATVDQDWLLKQFNPYMLVYDSPLATLPDGRAVPRQSTSWEMLFLGQVSDLNTTQSRARFYCDSQANWTDGIEMNAQDYRFTFEFYANNSLTNYSSLIEDVKVTGDYVAGVTYNKKDIVSYRVVGSLPILPRHIWENVTPSTWIPTLQESVGSGPYSVTSFTANSSLVLSRNAQYYPEIDASPPTLLGISIVPENPIPAESVVFRVFVEDRSRIEDVTLRYVYSVGQINFSESQLMTLGAQGYEATIPARVTASNVAYEITASDIWG